MCKQFKDYKIGDTIFWKSYEGIKQNGNGIVIDAWSVKNRYYITAKNSLQVVCLSPEDLRDKVCGCDVY